MEKGLYPLKFAPIRKEKIWGEELWSLSGLPNNDTEIMNGFFKGMGLWELFCKYSHLLISEAENFYLFPLLIKYIDCREDLSIQVHPDDDYAQQVENEPNGKAECWYILDAESHAKVIYGHQLESQQDFKNKVLNGEIEKYLNYVRVKKGDFFYVPPGTVHSLGKGIRLIEIQQSSDLTYRIYDWNRRDEKGRTRELHIEKALQVINFHCKNDLMIGNSLPFTSPFFNVELIEINGFSQYLTNNKYCILTIITGQGIVSGNGEHVRFKEKESIFIPASIPSYFITGKGVKILRSYH